jgi:hypothetical protein
VLRKFLIVDSNADNGALLVRSLIRKYPSASVQLSQDSAGAIETLAAQAVDVVVLHRTDTDDAVHLIEAFLRIAPDVPIVAVSGVNRSAPLLKAGAAAFLLYDEWLRLGSVVHSALEAKAAKASSPPIAGQSS